MGACCAFRYGRMAAHVEVHGGIRRGHGLRVVKFGLSCEIGFGLLKFGLSCKNSISSCENLIRVVKFDFKLYKFDVEL